MVLESLVTPMIAERRPFSLCLLGAVYATLGLFLALWVFEEYATLVMIFLTTIAGVPLFYHTVKFEEEKHLVIWEERRLLWEHSKALMFLMMIFIGASLAFAFWYVVLPVEWTTTLFSAQTQTIVSLNQKVTGNVFNFDVLTKIFLNNVKVMIFCVLFSFIYGTGALFILMWNASVIGVALGNFFRVRAAEVAGMVGWEAVKGYLNVAYMSVLRYSIHGTPEILAYVVAGLAGGIISIAIIRHDFGTKNFERIVLDASDLILIAVGILFFAALIEVYVTPLFF